MNDTFAEWKSRPFRCIIVCLVECWWTRMASREDSRKDEGMHGAPHHIQGLCKNAIGQALTCTAIPPEAFASGGPVG